MKKKLVQFGAGNIGRSFIGQIFSQNGYEIVFIDINQRIINSLNEKRSYQVIIKSNNNSDQTILIKNVRAVSINDTKKVVEEIIDTSYIATSVGKGVLDNILPIITKGILEKKKRSPDSKLDIIIAENIRDGAPFFSKELKKKLPADFDLTNTVGLIETSIGKMVPVMRVEDLAKDPLWVFAEPYNTLILDKKGFLNPIPDIPQLHCVDNIKAYVDRKSFIHNLGHAAAAYFGYQHNASFKYIFEALRIPPVMENTRQCMQQSKAALLKEYPDVFTHQDLDNHINDLLERFQNRALGDTIYRVGRDLYRKLDKSDRLIGAMLLAKKHKLPSNAIARAFIAALKFKAGDEKKTLFSSDEDFHQKESSKGVEYILMNVSHLRNDDMLEKNVIDEIMDCVK